MSSNEQVIRNFYRVAEEDIPSFEGLFTEDGYFWDVSADIKYYGKDLTPEMIALHKTFPDMDREIHDMYVMGDVVVVELSLNATQKGPISFPTGVLPATGKKMKAPCCDVFHIVDGKVKSFHCYSAGTIMLGQLGAVFAPAKESAPAKEPIS